MKTLKLLFAAAVLSLTTIACSSDDNKNNETTNSLVGKWTYEKEEALDANGKVVSTYIPDSYEFCEKDIYEFENNGTYVITQYEYYSEKCNSYTYISNWKLEGDILNVYDDDFNNTLLVKFEGDRVAFEHDLLTGVDAEEYDPSVTKIRVILKKI
jgi:hypothetical protein